MTDKNPHLTMLYVIRSLAACAQSSAALQRNHGISRATLNRHIAEARNMGAVIATRQEARGWLYSLENWGECRRTVNRWIELEEARTLV